MSFQGKVALVTGGAVGIGQTIALYLARRGATVAICDVNAAKGGDAAGEIAEEAKAKAVFIEADVSRRAELVRLMDKVVKDLGRLDILVNNAGIFQGKPWNEVTEEGWNKVLSVNLNGVFFGCQVAGEIMLKQGGGNILNMASISGRTARNVPPHYSTSKAGVISLTKNFATWLAPSIRVNAIAPGPVESEMTRTMPRETLEWISKKSLFGCIAKPEDVAEAAVFLLSDAARHITGITLDVNGGQFMD